MRKFILMTTVAAMAGLSATAVKGADYTPPQEVVGGYNWTGFYFGGHGGYGWGDVDWTFRNVGGGLWTGVAPFSQNFDPDGFVGGGQLGYLWQTSSFVWGGEVSGSVTGIDEKITSPAFPAVDTWRTEIDGLVLVQGIFGFAAESWLFSVKGGYASGWSSVDLKTTAFGFLSDDDSKQHNGFTVGGSIQYAFANNWRVGVEYNYVDLNAKTYSLSAQAPATRLKVDPNLHIVKGTLNFAF